MKSMLVLKVSGAITGLAMLALLMPQTVAAAPPAPAFSTFGSARLVVGGIPPDTNAIDLTSNCGNEAYSPTCYADPTFTFSGIAYTPSNNLTVNGISTLSADTNVGGANCDGGSPRIAIQGASATITCGYLGQNSPDFSSCDFGWLNTGNWASAADTTIRWDDGCNGTADNDWAEVQSKYGSQTVTEIDVILDGGWTAAQGQDLTVDNFTVNRNVMTSASTPPGYHNHQRDHCGF
jgi:hypothetical protein